MTTPHQSEQTYHHGNLRSALLQQAEVALAHGGSDGLSLRQLAREVGVSHGAPARHFADKQALLDALALSGFEALNGTLAAAASAEGTLHSRFNALIAAYVGFARDHPELLQLMYAKKHHESASEQLRHVGHEGMVVAANLLREAQLAGEIRPGDPDVLAVVATSHVHGMAVLAASNMLDGVSTELALSTTQELLWHGLRVTMGNS
jgi:AcrR family transcriptional regulator